MSSVLVVLVSILTLYACYMILLVFGVFEVQKVPSKVVSEIVAKRKEGVRIRRERWRLGWYTWASVTFKGLILSESEYERHKYFIQRLGLRSKVLDRALTPEEVRGRPFLFVLLSIMFLPLAVFSFLPIIGFVGALAFFLIYPIYYERKVVDEDEVIDNNFLNLYLLLFSKLRMGSRARLQQALDGYIGTLSSDSYDTMVMKKFSQYFLNLLASNEDHVAVPKLREVYRSATVVNFCNIATQALQGVDNYDSLISFKMSLVDRKVVAMRGVQAKMVAKGERSLTLIWLILLILAGVAFYAKLPRGVL